MNHRAYNKLNINLLSTTHTKAFNCFRTPETKVLSSAYKNSFDLDSMNWTLSPNYT